MPDRRTWMALAAVGLLAGALFIVTIEYVAGTRVILGLGWYRLSGSSPFGPDRVLVVDGRPALLPLVPVALGLGLVAGLVVAPVVHAIRAHQVVALPTLGVVAGALLALGTFLWRWNRPDAPGTVTYHGRYVLLDGMNQSSAYSSTLDITGTGTSTWWPLVSTGAGVGLLAGVLVLAALRVRLRASTSPSG